LNEKELQVKKNKIDLEHQDLIEKRNAIYLIEAGIVVALVTGFFTQIATIGNALLVGSFALALFDLFKDRMNRMLAEKRSELDRLLVQPI
jgi:hypothetical protein